MKKIFIIFIILPLVVWGRSFNEMLLSAWQLAKGTMREYQQFTEEYDLTRRLNYLDMEADELLEGVKDVKSVSDEIQAQFDASFSSLKNTPLPDFSADISSINALRAEYNSSLIYYDNSYKVMVSQANTILAQCNAVGNYINENDGFATWDWIIENFGHGYADMSKNEYEDLSSIVHCTKENCDCMTSKYFKYRYDYLYELIVRNLENRVWIDDDENQIPHGAIP